MRNSGYQIFVIRHLLPSPLPLPPPPPACLSLFIFWSWLFATVGDSHNLQFGIIRYSELSATIRVFQTPSRISLFNTLSDFSYSVCRPLLSSIVSTIFTFKRSIKVQFVVQFNIFRDKLAENFAFVLGNAIIFRVYSTGFLSPFSIAGFSRGYYANPFKVCY